MLGTTLKMLREHAELTLCKAATELDVTHAHIWAIENHRKKPSLDLIERMDKLYKVNVIVLDYLLNVDLQTLLPEIRYGTRILANLYRSKYEHS